MLGKLESKAGNFEGEANQVREAMRAKLENKTANSESGNHSSETSSEIKERKSWEPELLPFEGG